MDHFLAETWHDILTSLEDNRASVQLLSIDFEKAFNRMDHNARLASLTKNGASDQDVELVACFLRGRTMSVKIGTEFSDPRTVPGGSPQGSILGNFLLCSTTNEFNEVKSVANSPARITIGQAGPITPVPSNDSSLPSDSSYDSDREDGFNFRFFRKRNNPLDDTEVSVRMTQDEIDAALGVPERWVSVPAGTKAYIDDLNIVEKIRHSDTISHISQSKQSVSAYAPQSECIFSTISKRASELKMKVNEGKTQILCISAAKNSQVSSYINTETRRISSTDEMKILGFWFGKEPTVSRHIEKTKTKFRRRLWLLRHLKRSGVSDGDLLFFYKTIIRPVLDFTSVIYHPMLTLSQTNDLESLQRRAMKIIYGYDADYGSILDNKPIDSLTERREEMFKKYAVKCSKNARVKDKWLPLKQAGPYNTRHQAKYIEETCKTERLKNSPIYQIRRRMNEMTD